MYFEHGIHIQKLYLESAEQQGVLGYIARSAIDAILSGEQTDLSDAVFVYELTPGEGAENGIAASKDDAVILTNQNCYLLRANNGVEAVWCTPYESVGAKVSGEGDKTTGGGLAWGGGCSPSLTPELVMFTDNADPVKLLALDMKTGEIVASLPVLDDLPGVIMWRLKTLPSSMTTARALSAPSCATGLAQATQALPIPTTTPRFRAMPTSMT